MLEKKKMRYMQSFNKYFNSKNFAENSEKKINIENNLLNRYFKILFSKGITMMSLISFNR